MNSTEVRSPDLSKLTDRQRQLLGLIVAAFRRDHRSPTHRELAESLGVRGTTGIVSHLYSLARKGLLIYRQDHGKKRQIRLMGFDCPTCSGSGIDPRAPFPEDPRFDGLTGRQAEIMDIIVREIRRHHAPPTYRSIMAMEGIKSTNALQCHLTPLARKGWLMPSEGRKSRSIRLVGLDCPRCQGSGIDPSHFPEQPADPQP